MQKSDMVTDLEVTREDFAKNTDITPVSDPHIFSETQRMAQNQAMLSLAEKHPQEFKINKVLERVLKQMKVPNINEVLKDTPSPEQRTSADENAAMLIGQPSYAYIQQDHIAHLQDHLQFAMNPYLGQSPFADPNYLNNLIEHLKQHITLWYLNRSNGYVEQSVGKPVEDYDNPDYTPEIDKMYAMIGGHVMIDTGEVMGQFMPAIQKIIDMAKQKQNTPAPLPPDAQVVKDTSMAETERKVKKDQADIQEAQAKIMADLQKTQLNNQTKVEIENAKLTHQTIQHIATAQPQMPPEQPSGLPAQQPAPEMMPQPPQGDPNGNI
jgi:hypothetical protein